MSKEQMQRIIGIGFLLACLLLGVGFLLSRSTLYHAKTAKSSARGKLTTLAKAEPVESPKSVVATPEKKVVIKEKPRQIFKLDKAPVLLPPETTIISKPAPVKRVVRKVVRKVKRKPVKKVVKGSSWVLQVASFADRQSAQQFIRRLPGVQRYHIQKAKLGRGYRYRVQAGPFTNKQGARDSRSTLMKPYRGRAIIIRRG